MSKPIKICRNFNSQPNIQMRQDSNQSTKRKSEHPLMAEKSKSAKTDSSQVLLTISTKSEYSKMEGKSQKTNSVVEPKHYRSYGLFPGKKNNMILSATGKLIPLTKEMIMEMKKKDVHEDNKEDENKENLVKKCYNFPRRSVSPPMHMRQSGQNLVKKYPKKF